MVTFLKLIIKCNLKSFLPLFGRGCHNMWRWIIESSKLNIKLFHAQLKSSFLFFVKVEHFVSSIVRSFVVRHVFLFESDAFYSQWHRHTWKKMSEFSNRSRTHSDYWSGCSDTELLEETWRSKAKKLFIWQTSCVLL